MKGSRQLLEASLRPRLFLLLGFSAAMAFKPALALAGPILPKPLAVDVNTDVYRQTVTGDGARSFLINGTFQKTNIDAYFNQPSEKGPSLSSRLSLQASDDPLVMGRGDRYKALGGFFILSKPQHYRLEGGYLIPKATRATLTATVLGLGGYYQFNAPGRVTRLSVIGGQTQPGVEGSQFQRGVAGGMASQAFGGDKGSLQLFASFYRMEDVENSIKHRSGLPRLSIYVYSFGSELRSKLGLGLDWELAFLQNEKGSTGEVHGNALRISPSFKSDHLSAAANFERNSPRFINPLGSAAPDVKKVDGSLTIGRVNQLSLNSLYTQNNVENQLPATRRTQITRASSRLVPFQQAEFWKVFSVDAEYSVSRSGERSAVTESRLAALGLGLNETYFNTSIRGEYSPLRDFRDTTVNRDTFRATWQMGLKLKIAGKVKFDPSWNLSLERSRSLATGLVDPGGSASGGFTAAYSDLLTLGFRHDFQQRTSKPTGRKIRNEATQAHLRLLLKTKAPIQLGISFARKHYYDTRLNAFGEEELRGSVNVKF